MADSTNLGGLQGLQDTIRGQIVRHGDQYDAPKNIIQNVTSARTLYLKWLFDSYKRIILYSQMEGLLAGNPPYDPIELEKAGLKHISNFNTLDAQSMFEKSALAYWNLLNQAQTLVKFNIVDKDPQVRKFADIMAEEWDYVVRKWPSFNTLMNTMTGQLVKFGVSPVVWPDELDWRWRCIELQRFIIPDQASTDIEQVTGVCVEIPFTAQYLFEVYEKYKDTPQADTPWDPEALGDMLVQIANTFAKSNFNFINIFDLQQRLQNGDFTYDMIYTDSIKIVSMLYQEYDGKVSHYMFHRYYDNGKFLYFADRQYKAMNEAIVILTKSPGQFTIHANRGVGHKVFSMAQATMQLDNSVVDMARMSATPIIRSTAVGSKDAEAIRFWSGVPTNIGTAEFVQNNLGANITQLVAASNYFTGKLQVNIANSGQDPSQPDSSQGSIAPSTQRAEDFREFGVLKNEIAHFYYQFDRIVQNMTVKLYYCKPSHPGYEYAKEWKDRCLARGVPIELFKINEKEEIGYGMPKGISVRATRVAGDGSNLALLMGLQELQPIAPTFGPKAANFYKEQYITATLGPEYISAYTQDDGDADEQAGGASLAAVENAIMQMGKSPVFSADNEQRSHIVTHMTLGTEIIKRIQQQQMDAIEADGVFQMLVPHLEEHVQFLSQSIFAKSFLEQIKGPLNQITQYARLNAKNAQAEREKQLKDAQAAEGAQAQVMSDAQRKDWQALQDSKRADYKVQSQVARADAANQTRAQVQKEKVYSDADVQRLDVTLKNNIKQMQSSNDIRQEIADRGGNTPSPIDFEAQPSPTLE